LSGNKLTSFAFFYTDKPEIISFCPAGTKNCSSEKVETETDSVMLTCQVSAYPDAEVSWFYLGSDPANPELPLNTLANRIFDFHDGRLLINNLKRNDTGFYKCYASNSLGQDYAVMHLRVKGETKYTIIPILTTSLDIILQALLERFHILYQCL